ncbi:MurR/RpiR family transcriptional regulator [Planosporangium mesophilum]|uniref:Transcriptional regulator n=1 Tax=Planosporangium mesophilum TaxID=689768 RepID=A0A8J3TH80_9ACTN|nr:MurR/RpiR family transcriptional regulator [Planosporangium mesophilum]NJC86024.1 MurR/RpiR family transcriptional regulator [Planosporangium mesophilum]GII25531.1 transcriptional regulator [Planosporangium mesophilum]
MQTASRVLELFDGQRLTPAQRRIAQCLVEHAADAAYLSSGELAELAQVSQPSVTRFATALGFDGYPDLRRRIRELVADAPARTDERDEQNEVQRAVLAEAANLSRLAATLADRAPVEEAGRLLAASRPLPVLGLRAAAPMAAYFGYFAAKVHPDVRVLDAGGSALADRLEQARAGGATAMLAFVLPRYPREAHDALREARDLGLSTIVVTDSPVSPVAADADLTLAAAVGSRLVFDLHTAPLALACVLLQAMCDAAPTQTQSRLEAFEQSAARRQVFLP